MRLAVALLLGTIGSVGMWSFVVALPAVQADFGVARADASLPYTLTMIGFGIGGIVMGRLADRFGIVVPVMLGALALGAGYMALGPRPAGSGTSRWRRAAARLRQRGDLRAADRRHRRTGSRAGAASRSRSAS